MNRLKAARAICLLLFMASGLNGHVAADDDDDLCTYMPMGGSCPVTRYKAFYHDGSGPQQICPFGAICLLQYFKSSSVPAVAPEPALVLCSQLSPNSHWCQAWPHGDVSYTWAVGSGLTPQYPSHVSVAEQELICIWSGGSHLVSVTVTAPNGLTATGYASVRCGGEEP